MPEQLLKRVFGTDFTEYTGDPDGFRKRFLTHQFSLRHLHEVFEYVSATEHLFPHPFDKSKELIIPGCIVIGNTNSEKAAVFLAQTHGNEPVGLASFLLAMALQSAGMLHGKIYCVLGNIEAARRYWEVFRDNPEAPVYKRSFFRTVSASDEADEAKDLNRLPPKWGDLAKKDLQKFYEEVLDSEHYIVRRALKILTIALRPDVKLFFDSHSARQAPDGIKIINVSRSQMDLIEHGKFGALLKGVPEDLRIFPAGLLESLGINEPQLTLKSLVEIGRGSNVIPIIGVECGHHENTLDTMPRNIKFAGALLYNLGLSEVMPENYAEDKGEFFKYHVIGRKGLNYLEGKIEPTDIIYPVRQLQGDDTFYQESEKAIICEPGKSRILNLTKNSEKIEFEEAKKAGKNLYWVHQFRELEHVKKGQVVMIGIPSGNKFVVPEDSILLFTAKSSELYGKKPGMWPIVVKEQRDASNSKFSYIIKDIEKIILK